MNPGSPPTHAFPLHGLVLAGGRSARMGKDKACLIHPDGRPMARRACDLLNEAGCGLVALSLRADQEVPEGFDAASAPLVLRDHPESGAGPMAGMLAAFAAYPNARWLVVACDLPRLEGETLRALVAAWQDGQPFVSYRSEFDGLPEPLCAIYGPTALPLLEAAVRDGSHCPRKVLIRGSCPLLEPVVPRALENANTPEEWKQALPI